MKSEYLYIAGGILIIAVGYKVMKNVGNAFDSIGDAFSFDNPEDDKNQIEQSNDRLDEIIKETKPTYSDSFYKSQANKLEAAIVGFGNEPQEVVDVFDLMLSETDVRKLNAAFGMRNGENMNNYLKSDFLGDPTKRTVIFSGIEYSTFRWMTLADMVREILRTKGISYAI